MKGCYVNVSANDEPALSVEEQQLYDSIKLELGENPSLEKCAEQFFLVKKCWNDEVECRKHNMTFEKACHTLREVRDASWGKKGGNLLSLAANKLIWEMVDGCAPVVEVELAEQVAL